MVRCIEDVIECCLQNQQGLENLSSAFREKGINGVRLLVSELLTEEFVANELRVSNKIQCKKLIMAARRLSKQ